MSPRMRPTSVPSGILIQYSRLATIGIGRKLGGCLCPSFLWEAGSPSNPMSPGPRPASVPSGILIHPAVWPQYMGRKLGGCCVPFWGGGAGSPYNTMSPEPRPTSVSPYRGILIHPAVWPQLTWGESLVAVPIFGGAGSPSNTMWPGPRPTSVPSFILIDPAVWLQYADVTDRQAGETRQRSDSMGEPFYKRSPENCSSSFHAGPTSLFYFTGCSSFMACFCRLCSIVAGVCSLCLVATPCGSD